MRKYSMWFAILVMSNCVVMILATLLVPAKVLSSQ